MKKYLLATVGALFIVTGLFAQGDQTVLGKAGLGWTGVWGGFTTGLTAFEDDYALTKGGFGGLEFGRKLLIGWGGFHTKEPNDNFNSQYDLKYNGLILGYAVQSDKVIHPEFKLLVGGGDAEIVGEGSDRVFVVQPSAGIEVNVFKFFRFGLDGGYRFVTNTDIPNVQETDFSSFYGELKFKFGLTWGRR